MERYYNHMQEIWWRQTSSEVDLWGNHAGEFNLFTERDMRMMRNYLTLAARAARTEDTRARVGMVSDVFDAVYATWENSRGAREAVDFSRIGTDSEAERAEGVIIEMLEGQRALREYRGELVESDAAEYLVEYAGFSWELGVPWLVAKLIEYRLGSGQEEVLADYFRRIGEEYGEFATGYLGKVLGGAEDIRGVLEEGENMIINPWLESSGHEVNGLAMYDWAHDEHCPAGWYRWHPDRSLNFYSTEDPEAKSGIAYGIRGANAHDVYTQIHPAEPGEDYLVSARIKPSFGTGGARAHLAVHYWDSDRGWAGVARNFTIPSGVENDIWHRVVGVVTVPEDCRYIVIMLWGASFGDMGQDSVLFDDIRLIRINE